MHLSYVVVALALALLHRIDARPRWIDGQLHEEASETRSPFWVSILDGTSVKRGIRRVFKPEEAAAAGGGDQPPPAASSSSSSSSRSSSSSGDGDDEEGDVDPAAAAAAEAVKEEIAALVQEASEHMEKGNMTGVLDSFFGVLDKDPTRVDVLTVVGSILLQQSALALSEGFLFRAVTLSGWAYPPAVANLAEGLRQDNDLELALDVAQKGFTAVKEKDDTGMLQYQVAYAKAMQGDYKGGAEWFLKAAQAKPSSVDYWLQASTMLYPEDQRDLAVAEKVLLEGIEENPSDAKLLYQMGTVMHYTDRVPEAVPYYEESLRLEPDFHRAKSPLATAYHTLHRYEDAREKYADAVQHDPENVVLLVNYVVLLCTESGMFDLGLQVVAQAKEIDPGNEDVIRAENECLVNSGRVRTDL